MFLKTLEVQGIRCFEHAKVEFSRRITLLVGENNAGKSTLLQAAALPQRQSLSQSDLRLDTRVGAVSMVLGELYPWVINNRVMNPQPDGEFYQRWSAIEGHIAPTLRWAEGQQGFPIAPAQEPNNFIVPYLSARRAATYQENVGSQYAFDAGGTHAFLNSKVDRVCTDPDLRPLFEEACGAVLGLTISSYPTPNGKRAGLILDGRAQKYIYIGEMGAGVANTLGLVVELLVSREKLFIIEELENDLHPRALRTLLDLVIRSSRENANQFVLSTHSNVVVRHLGSLADTRVWQVSRDGSMRTPTSVVSETGTTPEERRKLLVGLGYDLLDYDLYAAWLILEESSAEALIREFLIPWFAPQLIGRIRTVAASGASDVEPRFSDLLRLFTFIHLEPVYKNGAWVLVDGDDAGRQAVATLHKKFSSWSPKHFRTLGKSNFEEYLPANFQAQVVATLSIADKDQRRAAKQVLLASVVSWARQEPIDAREAFRMSAREVIEMLQEIEQTIVESARD